ncbi:hypothetical protein V2J09_004776 [Rumex salicifolius]
MENLDYGSISSLAITASTIAAIATSSFEAFSLPLMKRIVHMTPANINYIRMQNGEISHFTEHFLGPLHSLRTPLNRSLKFCIYIESGSDYV